MNKRPNILIYNDLIEPIQETIKELNVILKDYDSDSQPKEYVDKGVFAYVIALLEGSVAECVERYLIAFPEQIMKGKLNFEKYGNEILQTDFSYQITSLLIQDYLTDSSYKNGEFMVKEYCKLLGIEDLTHLFTRKLNEKKARRNTLIHNNLKVDSKYLTVAKANPDIKGKYLRISPGYVIETIEAALEILIQLSNALETKYGSFTILKAIKDIWAHLFDSPIMRFEDYWGVNGNMLYIKTDTIAQHYDSLSSSEKTLLFYLIQNYHAGAGERIFKMHDLNMQVSNNDGMVFLVSVFDRYPLLLQDLNDIRPSPLFKYVREQATE